MKKIYLLGFVFSLHIALAAYVNSTFLSGIFGEQSVGMFYTISSILTLIIFGFSSQLLDLFGNRRLIRLAVATNLFALLCLGLSNNSTLIAFAFMAFIITNNLALFSIDIFFERLENIKTVGAMRGVYLSIVNIAWLVSPLFSGYLVNTYGHHSIYMVSAMLAFVIMIGLLIATLPHKPHAPKYPFWKEIVALWKIKHIRYITIVNFILHFFFSVMVIYTPIYLINHIGFDWKNLGLVFTVMLVPFVILGMPIGKLIDRGIKERYILYTGFTIAGLSTIAFVFVQTPNILVWMALLFTTRIGAAIIEVSSETYFFKRTKPTDTNLLSVFRDMSPLGYLAAPIFATIIIYVFPFNTIFIIVGLILLSGILIARKIND